MAIPLITGTTVQGSLLSITNGDWTNSPTGYTRQWMRCDAAGANAVLVPSVTAGFYRLGAADVGKTIRCWVTSHNAIGSSEPVLSAQTAVVSALAAAVPVNTVLPVITGTLAQGATLAVSNGGWTGSPTSYAYNWMQCQPDGSACLTEPVGNGNQTYVISAGDVGHALRCRVTATNATGPSATYAQSLATAVIGSPPPAPPPPASGKLTWAPPTLTTPLTVNVASDGTNREIYLAGRDAIINLGAYDCGQRGGLNIYDAGNVRIIGGKIYGTKFAHYLGLNIQNPRGIVHIEGVDFAGPWLSTAIALRTSAGYTSPVSAIIRIQNCRITGTVPPGRTLDGPLGEHPDTFQIEGNGATHAFAGQVQMDKVTHTTCNTALQAGTNSTSGVPTITLKRNNFRYITGADGTTLTAYMTQWYRTSYILQIPGNDVYGQVGAPGHTAIEQCMQPSAAAGRNGSPFTGLDKPVRGSDALGFYAQLSDVGNLHGKFREGIPPGGDYCPVGVPGVGYVSPGYL